MSKKSKTLYASFNGFKGIDIRKCHSGDESIYDITNFRICDDGSLEKRSGYRRIFSPSYTTRAIWSGKIDGIFYVYILDGPYVKIFDLETESYQNIGSVYSNSGPAQFFSYGDNLYVSDSNNIYIVTLLSVSPVVGYVPLYGKEWATTLPGEVNEPLNLLNRYARITYRATATHTNTLATKHPVDTILSIYRNGVLLDPSGYKYNSELLGIVVPNIEEGDFFEVNLRYNLELPHQMLQGCPYANIFGGAHNSRLFMWGEKSHKNLVIASKYVSQQEVEAAERDFIGCGQLYFPEGGEFTVGDYRNTINAMIRHYDRLLIFGENNTWMASDSNCDTDIVPILKISTSAGCPVKHGVVIGTNNPISIGNEAILEWTSDTDELSECNCFSISDEIKEKLSPEFFKKAIIFKDKYKDEIWFHQTGSSDTWIYNLKKKAWVRFTGISATIFFDADGKVGFVNTSGFVYIFDDTFYKDKFSGFTQYEIVGSLQTGIIDFNTANEKRLSHIELDADTDTGTLSVNLTSDRNESIDVLFSSEEAAHIKERKRISSDRISFLKHVTISAPGEIRQRIHKLKIAARRNDK